MIRGAGQKSEERINMQTAWNSKHTPWEVIAALTDFARLSQQASALLTSSLETPDTLGLLILTRLLALCHANQGTLLLSFQAQGTGRRATSTVPTDQQAFPLVIRCEMSEEAATTALTSFSPDGPDIQVPATTPHTLIWRRMISMQPEEGDRASGKPPTEQREPRPPAQTAPLACAYFVLHWSETDHQRAEQALLSTKELLPLITDAINAVMVNVLLALRVQDLEHLAYRKTEQSNELLKAELLATVSHELRSPLASIQGYTTTLLRHDQRISPEERHAFLVEISKASARLETIVNRLLEVSQLETNTVPFEPLAVNVIHLIQEALTAARRFAGTEADTSIETNLHPVTYTLHIEQEYDATSNEELIIQGDRRWLRTLLDHLLENAVHYSPPDGKIEMGVRTLRHQEALVALEQQWQQEAPTTALLPSTTHWSVPLLEIWIKDAGSGIALEHLKHIFDRFYRVDMSLTREVNGLGLGLSICKSIVELHGGTIWVESKVGKGSIFHVLLPQHEHASPATDEIV
jgi:signal transduction histidine kinase